MTFGNFGFSSNHLFDNTKKEVGEWLTIFLWFPTILSLCSYQKAENIKEKKKHSHKTDRKDVCVKICAILNKIWLTSLFSLVSGINGQSNLT